MRKRASGRVRTDSDSGLLFGWKNDLRADKRVGFVPRPENVRRSL
jgi:hypothetical protein